MKKWITIAILGLSILGTIGGCAATFMNGKATAATATEATAKVINDAKAIKDAYNADNSDSATEQK